MNEVSLSLRAAVLAAALLPLGCVLPPASGPTPSVTASSSPAPASAVPSASALPTSPAPAPTAVPEDTWYGAVHGNVRDAAGAPVAKGNVRFVSLHASLPFETEVPIVDGRYNCPQVMLGVQLKVTATMDHGTSREQVVTLPPPSAMQASNVVDFGGGTNPFFLSTRPEIVSVDPADGAEKVDPAREQYTLTLSAPLTADSQQLFAQALRLMRADQPLPTGAHPVQAGTSFLAPDNKAVVAFDASGTTATLRFKVNLPTSKSEAPHYAFALASGGTGARIVDMAGDQLGMSAQGFTAYPQAGEAIQAAFKPASFSPLPSADLDEAARWKATHQDRSSFAVALDTHAPAVTSLTWVDEHAFQLAFSEPMGAYDFNLPNLVVENGVLNPEHYVFRLAKSVDALGSTALGESGIAAATFAEAPLDKDFVLQGGTHVALGFNLAGARVVTFRNAGTEPLFPLEAHALRLRALPSVMDPAGNACGVEEVTLAF